jgi:Anti-sigma-28 factor, FlgM
MRVTRLEELAERIARGEYAVDPHAVAAAMLAREPWASAGLSLAPSVFEPAQPLDRPPVPVEQDQPTPGADVA